MTDVPMNIPSEEEIKQLPRWAQVAFAARCARRVQPLFTAFWPDAPQGDVDAIERVISTTERSAVAEARADPAIADPGGFAAAEAADVAANAAIAGATDAARAAARATADAARAASDAAAADAADARADRADPAADAVAAYAAAATHARAAARLVAAAVARAADVGKIYNAFVIAMRNDFDRLLELSKQEKWNDKTPVSPEVFGDMWPEGEPDWNKIAAQSIHVALPENGGAHVSSITTIEGNGKIEIETWGHKEFLNEIIKFLKEKKNWPDNGISPEEGTSSYIPDVVLRDPDSQIVLAVIEIKISHSKTAIQKAAKKVHTYISSTGKDVSGYIVCPSQSADHTFEIWECEGNDKPTQVSADGFPTYKEMLFMSPLKGAGRRLYKRLIRLTKEKYRFDIHVPCSDYINLRVQKNHRKAAQIHRVKDSDQYLALALAGYQKEFPDIAVEPHVSRGEINQLSGNTKEYRGEIFWLKGTLRQGPLRYPAGVYILKPGSLAIDKIENAIGNLLDLARNNAEYPSKSEEEEKGISSDVVRGHVADQATKNDKLGFRYFVEGMAEFLTSPQTEAPLALSVEGPWGTGKSSFMMMLKERLEKEGKPTVWFNAWRHDKAEAMCATFALVFLEEMNKSKVKSLCKMLWALLSFKLSKSKRYGLDFCRSLRGQFKLFCYRFNWSGGWLDVLRFGAMWTLFFIAVVLGFYFGWKAGYAFFDKLLTDWVVVGERAINQSELLRKVGGIGGLVGVISVLVPLMQILKKWLGNPFEVNLEKYVAQPDYEGHVQFIEKFHNDFEKIVRAYAGNQKVYVFIDDIDRCMVPKSADLMQAMNMLICNSPNLIFIVGMDREKVAAGLAVKFEKLLPYLLDVPDNTDKRTVFLKEAQRFGYDFIEKFIQLPFTLPKPNEAMIHDYVRQLCGGENAEKKVSTPIVVEKDVKTDSDSVTKDETEDINVDRSVQSPSENNQEPHVEQEEIEPTEAKKREAILKQIDTDHELLCWAGGMVAKIICRPSRKSV